MHAVHIPLLLKNVAAHLTALQSGNKYVTFAQVKQIAYEEQVLQFEGHFFH